LTEKKTLKWNAACLKTRIFGYLRRGIIHGG
jgi:hypothetical protein